MPLGDVQRHVSESLQLSAIAFMRAFILNLHLVKFLSTFSIRSYSHCCTGKKGMFFTFYRT